MDDVREEIVRRSLMIKGIYHSAAGMLTRYLKLSTIANNLANASTSAFKVDRRHFSTLLNNELIQPGPWGKPTRIADLEEGLHTIFAQGPLTHTGTDTHIALNGAGFFVVENPDNEERFFTRNGHFRLNDAHELVTADGLKVLDDAEEPIVISKRPFLLNEDGDIFIDGRKMVTMMVADFEDLSQLLKRGNSLYSNPSDMALRPKDDETRVLQAHLEESNVNVVQEMVEMISLNRNYESSQRALTAQSESLRKAVNEVSKY